MFSLMTGILSMLYIGKRWQLHCGVIYIIQKCTITVVGVLLE